MAPPAYRVEDRSILLPLYRRALIDPLLPHIPARVSPNAITHAGHVINLVGLAQLLALRPARGAPFYLAALTLHLHVWCDNADGGHARRTGQCSPMGEFLDHGLDALNVVYIAMLSCLALDVPPWGWIALTLIIPSAASVTFWEQSHTGVFRLGLLNQVEAAIVLSLQLVLAGALGRDFSTRLSLGGVTLQAALLAWSITQIGVGILRSLVRGARHEPAALASIAPLGAFNAAVGAGWATGAVSLPWAVAVGAVGNVFFGVRMLVRRMGHEPPRVEPSMLGASVALGLAATLPRGPWGDALAALIATALALGCARDGREGVRRSLRG